MEWFLLLMVVLLLIESFRSFRNNSKSKTSQMKSYSYANGVQSKKKAKRERLSLLTFIIFALIFSYIIFVMNFMVKKGIISFRF